jgi:hypothetical protein
MSQWLDMVAGNSNTVDTSSIGWNSGQQVSTVATVAQTAARNTDNTMLYLTGAGVLLAALAYFRGGRK